MRREKLRVASVNDDVGTPDRLRLAPFLRRKGEPEKLGDDGVGLAYEGDNFDGKPTRALILARTIEKNGVWIGAMALKHGNLRGAGKLEKSARGFSDRARCKAAQKFFVFADFGFDEGNRRVKFEFQN